MKRLLADLVIVPILAGCTVGSLHAFQPFQKLRVEFLNDGQAGKFVDLLAVPAGKRAVIETVTVNNQLPQDKSPKS